MNEIIIHAKYSMYTLYYLYAIAISEIIIITMLNLLIEILCQYLTLKL